MSDLEEFVTDQMCGDSVKLLELLKADVDLGAVEYWAYERSSAVNKICLHMNQFIKTSDELIFTELIGELSPVRVAMDRIALAGIAAIGALTTPYGYVILNTDAKELRKANFYEDQDTVIAFFRQVKSDLFG